MRMFNRIESMTNRQVWSFEVNVIFRGREFLSFIRPTLNNFELGGKDIPNDWVALVSSKILVKGNVVKG